MATTSTPSPSPGPLSRAATLSGVSLGRPSTRPWPSAWTSPATQWLGSGPCGFGFLGCRVCTRRLLASAPILPEPTVSPDPPLCNDTGNYAKLRVPSKYAPKLSHKLAKAHDPLFLAIRGFRNQWGTLLGPLFQGNPTMCGGRF